jgi:hypothetical protein
MRFRSFVVAKPLLTESTPCWTLPSVGTFQAIRDAADLCQGIADDNRDSG